MESDKDEMEINKEDKSSVDGKDNEMIESTEYDNSNAAIDHQSSSPALLGSTLINDDDKDTNNEYQFSDGLQNSDSIPSKRSQSALYSNDGSGNAEYSLPSDGMDSKSIENEPNKDLFKVGDDDDDDGDNNNDSKQNGDNDSIKSGRQASASISNGDEINNKISNENNKDDEDRKDDIVLSITPDIPPAVTVASTNNHVDKIEQSSASIENNNKIEKVENENKQNNNGDDNGEEATSAVVQELEARIEKLNRLLMLAKTKISDSKNEIGEKDALIKKLETKVETLTKEKEKLIELAKRAQQRISTLENTLASRERDGGDNADAIGSGESSSYSHSMSGRRIKKRPISAERKVDYMDNSWILVRLEGTNSNSNDPIGYEWILESELLELFGNTGGLPFPLPEASIDSTETRNLKAIAVNAKAEMVKAQDEYRKFRIKADIARKQKEAEISRLSEENLRYKQQSIVGHDSSTEMAAARQQIEKLSILNAELEVQNERCRKDVLEMKQRVKDVEGIAEQWRWRCEQQAHSFGGSVSPHMSKPISSSSDSAAASSEARVSGLSLNQPGNSAIAIGSGGLADALSQATTQFAKLKREYEHYRKRALQVVEDKENELEELKSIMRSAGLQVPERGENSEASSPRVGGVNASPFSVVANRSTISQASELTQQSTKLQGNADVSQAKKRAQVDLA